MAQQFIRFLQPTDKKLTLTTGRKFIIQLKPRLKALRADTMGGEADNSAPPDLRSKAVHSDRVDDRAAWVDAAHPVVHFARA